MISNKNIGILLTNIGSPDAPTNHAVRSYLKKFLSDPHVVTIPRIIWQPILHGFILPFRSKKSAALYQKIWTKEGSPLSVISEKMVAILQEKLNLPVALGMHYGHPFIADALEKLHTPHIQKIIVLPLYPQYSTTTTAVTFDQVTNVLKTWSTTPIVTTIPHYSNNENYISALVQTVLHYPIQHLLFSFHGIPKHFVDDGDVYFEQCCKTVQLVTEKCQLPKEKWSIAFQSRLGHAKWLTPYTNEILQDLPKRGITDLHVIAPGFAVDCLETLEEIAIRGKKQFIDAGGKSFHYIPALNDSHLHVTMLQKMLLKQIGQNHDPINKGH